ncbi:hypothetical protein CRG98_007335 [Punica granatum]|uniref:Uncharacterized protein n=1 Tax=Punica granatum TaxID=22663 RepID=A0A2I0KUX3_PUNGR|nr:hypothetical protein CRG98_007335 [Punica granatum]
MFLLLCLPGMPRWLANVVVAWWCFRLARLLGPRPILSRWRVRIAGGMLALVCRRPALLLKRLRDLLVSIALLKAGLDALLVSVDLSEVGLVVEAFACCSAGSRPRCWGSRLLLCRKPASPLGRLVFTIMKVGLIAVAVAC